MYMLKQQCGSQAATTMLILMRVQSGAWGCPSSLSGELGARGGVGVWLCLPRCVGMHHWYHLIHTINVTGLMSGKESLGTTEGRVEGRICTCVCVDGEEACVLEGRWV